MIPLDWVGRNKCTEPARKVTACSALRAEERVSAWKVLRVKAAGDGGEVQNKPSRLKVLFIFMSRQIDPHNCKLNKGNVKRS